MELVLMKAIHHLMLNQIGLVVMVFSVTTGMRLMLMPLRVLALQRLNLNMVMMIL